MENSLRFDRAVRLSRHFFVMLFFSFLGWAWETVYVSYLAGELVDRGFFLSPVCPIYGSCLVALYYLLGTPNRPRGLLKNLRNPVLCYGLYILFAGLIPTAAELVIGAFFHQVFDVRLWTYEANPYNFYGYICLYNSIFWAFGITAVMRLVYGPVLRLMERMKDRTALRAVWICLGILAVDGLVSFRLLIF